MPENNNQKPNFYQLYQTVGNIDGKLDRALKMLENHEKRINLVEHTQDQIVGKITLIGSIFGMIGAFVISIIKGKFFN